MKILNTNIWLTTFMVASFSLIGKQLKAVAQPLQSNLINFNSHLLSYSANDLNLAKITEPASNVRTSYIKQPIEFNGESIRLKKLISRKNFQFPSSVLFVSSSKVPQLAIATEPQTSQIARSPEEPTEEFEQPSTQFEPETANTGQDPTQPITRFEVQFKSNFYE